MILSHQGMSLTANNINVVVTIELLSHIRLCNPKDCSTPGFSVLHHLPEFAQIHGHWVKEFHPTVSSSVVPFSSCLQSFSASGSFPMSWLFPLSGWNIGASASASVLPMNIQCPFPLGLTGLISLLSTGLSWVFFSTTVWKHHFFSSQPSLWSNSHVFTWLLEKPWPCQNISECFRKHLGIFR